MTTKRERITCCAQLASPAPGQILVTSVGCRGQSNYACINGIFVHPVASLRGRWRLTEMATNLPPRQWYIEQCTYCRPGTNRVAELAGVLSTEPVADYSGAYPPKYQLPLEAIQAICDAANAFVAGQGGRANSSEKVEDDEFPF